MFHPKTVLRRLAEKRQNEEGFTLVELMVVVLIIGILVAIAIPVFLNAQGGAKGASAKADAKNIMTEVQSYYASNNAIPTLAQLTADGSPLQGKSLVSAAPTDGQVYYATGTVVARGNNTCFKATFTATQTYFDKTTVTSGTACTTTALTANGTAW